jgi:amino acid transporter
LALLLIAGLAAANMIGVRFGATVQNATVVAKLITIAVIAGLAFALGGHEISGPVEGASGSTWLGPTGLVFAMRTTRMSHRTAARWQRPNVADFLW